MRFLVTNDDGINCPFMHELVLALCAESHEVFVAAPKHEQSWGGASKSRGRPVHVEHLDAKAVAARYPFRCPTWIVDGTPCDAVNIALGHLLPPDAGIDAVLSGINIGLNASLGFILASGTIGGAWEGALHGLPAIALSHDLTSEIFEELKAAGDVPKPELHACVRASAVHAAKLAPELVRATPKCSFTVHNLNFPLWCSAKSELRRTIPARVVVPRLFSPAADDGTHRLIFRLGDDLSAPEPLTDRAALASGYISHSILDYRALGAMTVASS